jgi:hypothetical protein
MGDERILSRLDRIEESISGLIVGFADRDQCLEMLGEKMDELLRLMNEPPPSGGGLQKVLADFAMLLKMIAESVAGIDRRLAALERLPRAGLGDVQRG